MDRLQEIVDKFTMMDDREFKLQLLLDYAEKLPELPEHLNSHGEREKHRVHECMTPVSLWVFVEGDRVRLHADVPRESPTVRGFMAILIAAFDGAAPAEVLAARSDILNATGLAKTIGMNRTHGLSSILQRVRKAVAAQSGTTD